MQFLLKEDTPAYKMAKKGTNAMSDCELLALVISGGQTQRDATNAMHQAAKVLDACRCNLNELGKMSASALKEAGLTAFQAKKVVSAWEIGRRRQLSDLVTRPRISSSRDAANCIAMQLEDLPHEEFWLLLLNRANEVTERKRISSGGTSGTVVDIKMVLRYCIEKGAVGFIAVHNHPSGNLEPSRADVELTEKMKHAGKIIDMPMLDHLIISERGYYSFADEGMI